MNQKPRAHLIVGLIAILCLALAGAGKGGGKQSARPRGKLVSEPAWVINAVDNTGRGAIVVRAGGKVYRVRKGSGCASVRAYDSQKIPVFYPAGAFLSQGSYFDIVQEGERCMVDEAMELKKGDLHAVSTEFEERKAALVKKFQEALAKLGKFSGEPDGKLDAETVAAFKAFQKGRGLKPTGDVNAEFLLELFVAAQKKDDLELLTHLAKTIWPYAAVI